MRCSILLVVLFTLATACTVPAESHSHLSGSNWAFLEIDGQVPVSSSTKLTFEQDHLGANVGCNGMGGPWRVENERLIAGPLVQTEMYCPGTVWEQEQSVSALLAGAPRVEVNGQRLTLTTNGHRAELQRTEQLTDK